MVQVILLWNIWKERICVICFINITEKLPFDEAKELILSVLYILKNVHMNGILHRDIAPDNVFITEDKIVKLIVFGAARHAVRQPSEETDVLLKVGYAPVEQYYVDGKQGAWTDMYEVGALFYRMLTGVKPIPSIERVKKDTLQLPSELGVELPGLRRSCNNDKLEYR